MLINVCILKAMVFLVVMYWRENWTIKKTACERIDAFELWHWRILLRSPLDCKEINPVSPKGNRPRILIRRADTEAEAPILWPPELKVQLIRKDSDTGKYWMQEKGMTEDEMVSWHLTDFNGHQLSSLLHMLKDREVWHMVVHGITASDTTEWLNNNNFYTGWTFLHLTVV